jgi:hypothetical protein
VADQSQSIGCLLFGDRHLPSASIRIMAEILFVLKGLRIGKYPCHRRHINTQHDDDQEYLITDRRHSELALYSPRRHKTD